LENQAQFQAHGLITLGLTARRQIGLKCFWGYVAREMQKSKCGGRATLIKPLKEECMRKVTNSILAICALAFLSMGVLADDHDKILKEHFEFSSDVMVGSTMVKKGFYLVKYNTETGTVKVVDESDGKKVIATAKASLKLNDKSFDKDEILTKDMSGHQHLIGLRLGGQKEELMLSDAAASVGNN
jgi:hypothetical protein